MTTRSGSSCSGESCSIRLWPGNQAAWSSSYSTAASWRRSRFPLEESGLTEPERRLGHAKAGDEQGGPTLRNVILKRRYLQKRLRASLDQARLVPAVRLGGCGTGEVL